MREKFIKMAQSCFSRHGFKKTTMDDIARAAGKAKSLLYYYFKSKEDVMRAIVENEAAIMGKEILAAVEKETDPRLRLQAYIVTRFAAVIKTANYYNLLQADYLEHYASLEKTRAQHDANEKQLLKDILHYGVVHKTFVIADIDLLAESLVLVSKGFELRCLNEKDLPDLNKHVVYLVDTLCYGLIKR